MDLTFWLYFLLHMFIMCVMLFLFIVLIGNVVAQDLRGIITDLMLWENRVAVVGLAILFAIERMIL